MPTKFPVSTAISLLLPAGALGASLLLAISSAHAAASAHVPEVGPAPIGVGEHLRAIRAGVSALSTQAASDADQIDQGDGSGLVPTWWGNGGWGRWGGGWGNGGWRFGWHNGGWGNGGWHNWGNAAPPSTWANAAPPSGWSNAAPPSGWNNWGNGWHNFWHNG